ncbi:DNA polymerase III subunit delta' [Desulfococcaceae bacterium HSG8]|nr:DNA polymerase III subunit delta' [Desulfococcaceae bacterium HSG8]
MIHNRASKWLSAFIRKETIPHALLFTGIEGVGKRTSAMTFAMACNCPSVVSCQSSVVSGPLTTDNGQLTTDNGPCGDCRSCRKIRSGSHPDISLVEPSGTFIRIAQIRELCHTLSMKPYEARMRVVIIANAQAMNPEAGNALLKVLEEPPERTVLILTAIQTSDLLPTIVSRCQHIRFDPIPRERLETLLLEKKQIRPDDAEVIATLANGSYSKAFSISRTNWINRRKWLIRELESLVIEKQGHGTARMLAFAERLSKNKDILPDLLEVMKTWLRDIVVCKYDPEKIINRDLGDSIQHASRKITVASLLSKIKSVDSARKNLRANANLRLTMEVLVCQLSF